MATRKPRTTCLRCNAPKSNASQYCPACEAWDVQESHAAVAMTYKLHKIGSWVAACVRPNHSLSLADDRQRAAEMLVRQARKENIPIGPVTTGVILGKHGLVWAWSSLGYSRPGFRTPSGQKPAFQTVVKVREVMA